MLIFNFLGIDSVIWLQLDKHNLSTEKLYVAVYSNINLSILCHTNFFRIFYSFDILNIFSIQRDDSCLFGFVVIHTK